jgi:hypothetical protein
MMTGPEHYREATRLVSIPADERGMQMAQVHATLALAAAAAAVIPDTEANHPIVEAWFEAGAW